MHSSFVRAVQGQASVSWPAQAVARNANLFPVPARRKGKTRTMYVPGPKPAPVPSGFPSDFRGLYTVSLPEITGDETFLRKH